MKKILLFLCMVFITNTANARVEYYASAKFGLGDTTIYLDGDTNLGDWLVQESEHNTGLDGFNYDASGLLFEISPAVGIDWSMNNTYGTKSKYGWFHLRLEGEIGYNHYNEKGDLKYFYAVTDKTKISFNQMFILTNGYMDFHIENIIPYVGAGIGYGFGNQDVTIENEFGEFNDSGSDDGIIYALHLGMAYKYSDITTFDLGFRRVWAPTTDDGQYVFDSVRFGARFRI